MHTKMREYPEKLRFLSAFGVKNGHPSERVCKKLEISHCFRGNEMDTIVRGYAKNSKFFSAFDVTHAHQTERLS